LDRFLRALFCLALTQGGCLPFATPAAEVPISPPPVSTLANGALRVTVPFAIPIALGHYARITWYRGTDAAQHPYEPLIEDLESGVTFGSDWVYQTPGAKRSREPELIGPMRPGIVVERSITARVVGCRVLFAVWARSEPQTELVLAPDPAAPAPPAGQAPR
jgi:hypothetical protein